MGDAEVIDFEASQGMQMAGPTFRGGDQKILGSRGTTGSPDNPQAPFFTPGPLGVGDGSKASIDGAGVNSPPYEFIMLWKERFVAQATDTYLTPMVGFPVEEPGLPDGELMFGQDIRFGTRGGQRKSQSVGTEESDLRKKCARLIEVFAPDDDTGMAKRLMDAFLMKRHTVRLFEDDDMNESIAKHPNFKSFSSLVLSAPGTPGVNTTRVRLHQALKQANWDINAIPFIGDLGILAFNKGDKFWGTEDFATGLGLMINGVQYALVYATSYLYNPMAGTYDLHLRFVFYDVFGLDDDDLDEYGAESGWNVFNSQVGITAWWQLQHHFNYAPLVTRAVVTRKYLNVPAI